MKQLISDLRKLRLPLPPGLSRSVLALAEEHLGAPLCPQLEALYLDHDGMPFGIGLPMRLMAIADVLETNVSIRQFWPDLLADDAFVFWTDDESNYAGAYLAGQLSHRVFVLDHEEPDGTPRFRDTCSFTAALLAQKDENWHSLTPDYPAQVDKADAFTEVDRELGRTFLQSYLASPEEARSALLALALLPVSDTVSLLPLLASTDMWVQERTCEVLGLRRYAPAVQQLAEVVRNGTPNGRVASFQALERIGTKEALDVLRLLETELSDEHRGLIKALKRMG